MAQVLVLFLFFFVILRNTNELDERREKGKHLSEKSLQFDNRFSYLSKRTFPDRASWMWEMDGVKKGKIKKPLQGEPGDDVPPWYEFVGEW